MFSRAFEIAVAMGALSTRFLAMFIAVRMGTPLPSNVAIVLAKRVMATMRVERPEDRRLELELVPLRAALLGADVSREHPMPRKQKPATAGTTN